MQLQDARVHDLLRHPGRFAWHTLRQFRANQGLLLAGAVAYYALLSIVPLLILMLIALSHVIEPDLLLSTLARYLEWVVPGQSRALTTELAAFLRNRGTIGWVLLGTMLFFSSLAFTVLENAMSVIFVHRVAIRRRHFDQVLAVISDAAADEKPLRQFARELTRGMIAAHSIHPTLHQVLLDEAPGDRGSRAAHAAFQSRYLEHYAAAVAQYRRRTKDTETVARVLSSAVEGVIHNAARRGMLEAPELQKQLVDLICAYLSGQHRAAAR